MHSGEMKAAKPRVYILARAFLRTFLVLGLSREGVPEIDYASKRQSVVEHSVALSTTLQKAMADITSLESRKADIISLQIEMSQHKVKR